MEWNFKYSYSFYEDTGFSCEYDSIEEALQAAKEDAQNDDEFRDAKTVYIGKVCEFVPVVDADNVIEGLQNEAYCDADDAAQDYLEDVSIVDLNKLQEMLTETFNKWAKETGNEPNFYTVEDVEEYSLEDDDDDC